MSEPILRAYGFAGRGLPEGVSEDICCVSSAEPGARLHDISCRKELGQRLYYRPRRWPLWGLGRPIYYALLPHVTFLGAGLEPVWVNDEGRAVVAWYRGRGETRKLLVGLDVEEEIIRHRQGDPSQVEASPAKAKFGFDFERPNYLFEGQLLSQYPTCPWADHLGYLLTETIARLGNHPLVEPFPGGAKGLLLLTGDDDQAWLEKYQEQLRTIGDVPITYFLHHKTRHTQETVAKLPFTVEFGVHPDAVDEPDAYERLCAEQVRHLRELTKRPLRAIRNHGFLNRGYLGHLQAWEANDLRLDLNYPGVDGTALTASFLPMRVRRRDGGWSRHYALLTLFGDGMIYALRLSQRHAVRKIRRLVAQIERSQPGVLACNFHPQNIDDTRGLHEEVVRLARRPGWIALGVETYLRWLETLQGLQVESLSGDGVRLTSSEPISGLVLRVPDNGRWRRKSIEPWVGTQEVRLS